MSQNYDLGNYKFDVTKFFPQEIFDMITEVRVSNPGIAELAAEKRSTRKTLTLDGKLTILAADHPGRMVTKSGSDTLIMGNRQEYLGRALRVITSPGVDGIMSTPDIIEDLLILDFLIQEKGGASFLNDRILMGCMNRGGLAGVSFEMDDRMTAFSAERMAEMRIDAAKMMFRLEPTEDASGWTIDACAKAVNECHEFGIPAFIEPLWVDKTKGYKNAKSAPELIKCCGVASALGYTSTGTWLKIPYCDNFELVTKSSTCPILMLGGASTGNPTDVINEFTKGMKAGNNVRGALVGRNVLFPGDDDPLAVALAINGVVHKGFSTDDAVAEMGKVRGTNMDALTKVLTK